MVSRWGNSGNSGRLYFWGGSKITADCNCSHEIKRCLFLGRKVMTNLESVLKSIDITLLTKVHLVKAMVFPAVMDGCKSWTIKKAKHQRIDAFELWCWRRLLRVFQHHSLKASILRHSVFFIVQLSHPYMTTGKTIALTRRTLLASNVSAF